MKLIYRPDGRSRGRGFLKFSSAEAVENALTLNNSQMMGRRIVVEKPRNRTNIADKPPKFFAKVNGES